MKILLTSALAAALIAPTTFADDHEKKDIVDTAVAAGSFSTLAAAVTEAELVDALKSEGPFTVFAPTDKAFAALPEGTVEMLLKPENRAQLVSILTYHVVPGRVPASAVVDLSGAVSLQGQRLDISASDRGVKIDEVKVIQTDIECSNGIIHVIDGVLMPASADIVATADGAGTFRTLIAAAKAAGLAGALTGDDALTVLAPNDAAFAKLPSGTIESLLKPENKDQLVAILTYHVIPGRVYSEEVLAKGRFDTLEGSAVEFRVDHGKVTVQDAVVLATDIDASNGVIHVIDTVIMPPKETARAESTCTQGMTASSWN